MPTSAVCPQCQSRFDIPQEPADSIKSSAAIQSGPAPSPPAIPTGHSEPGESARLHPWPRSQFRTVAALVLALGFLIFLLAVSVGFNAWILLFNERHRLRDMDIRRGEEELMRAREMAERNAADARQQALQAELDRQEKIRQHEDLKTEVKNLRLQLEEARRPAPKEPEK